MFPNSYTYNPGVVLDPVTMAPMISNGAITVNPLGVPMRPQQKIWQKMFIKDIPQECTNELMARLLKEFGAIKNFKRLTNNRGRLTTFCQFDLETGEEILRIRRLFHNIKILDKTLQLKISPQTQNFVKQWLTMQKDQWRKKLLAHGMNQAKQYQTIEQYHQRQDKRYKQNIQQTLKLINVEVKKIAVQKMREQQRKQHPKQKQRQKRKRQILDDLQKKYDQKEQYWSKRQRQRERQNRKEREKQKERQKARQKKLERQMQIQPDQQAHRISKFKQYDRRKMLQKQEQEDLDRLEQQHPPQPQQVLPKKSRFTVKQELILGEGNHQEVIVNVSTLMQEQKQQPKQRDKKSQYFQGWQSEDIVNEDQNIPKKDLRLPQIQEQKQQDEQYKAKLVEISTQVPQNKLQLWQFPIDWEMLSKSVVLQKRIRPWLEKRSCQYMGGVEQKFIALVQKKLFSKSHPDKIIKILKQLIDEDAEEFVIKLWKTLVFQSLKLKAGIN